MLKRAIIVVSFGTSYDRACNEGIVPIENAVSDKFSDCKVVRAFTSSIIRKKLKKEKSLHIDSPAEAIERLLRSGYSEIYIQPTLIIPGKEYDKLVKLVEQYRMLSEFINISLGKPLMHDDEDIRELTECFCNSYSEIGDVAGVVLVGHGTKHYANSMYYQFLNYAKKKCSNVFLAVVENESSFRDVAEEIFAAGIKKVELRPFMIVAGDHAENDMASDDDDSLKSHLMARGIESSCSLVGMGGRKSVQNIFIRHIEALMCEQALVP